ncbi:ATP-binding protein [Actinomadura keratinilytica]|uniref:ATP-binding protein n=1 Tax=Actinomadura keratinilytica TaxID=547461 RepID=UPI00360949D1
MEISLDLRLPRDAASVPAARRLLDSSPCALGVDAAIRGDIELMLTEACTNAIRHAGRGGEYTVRVGILDERCVIKVIDSGPGYGAGPGNGAGPGEAPGPLSEHGRGMLLMRALADGVRFGTAARQGALVSLEKHLHYGRDTLGSLLADHAGDGRWRGGVCGS